MSETPLPFRPVVILGAGRSGTNILRDTLTELDGVATWPCDEINPIWRHGNLHHPSDAIPAAQATTKVLRFIRQQFSNIWAETGKPQIVVEKTCANTLRVPFVQAVLPEAKFIHIVRNGNMVVPSAQKRWRGELEVDGRSYFLAKAKYAPKRDLPFYLSRFLQARAKMMLGNAQHLDIWGPRFEGMSQITNTPLIDICALQWAHCVRATTGGLAANPGQGCIEIRYEDLVTTPTETLKSIVDMLADDISNPSADELSAATRNIRSPSKKRGTPAISKLLRQDTRAFFAEVLQDKGYPS